MHVPARLPEPESRGTQPALEADANAAVDDHAVSRGPEVDGPAPIVQRRRLQERIVLGLTDVEDVLGIDEQAHAADAALPEQSDEPVRPADRAIRIVLEGLLAGVVHLDADAATVLVFPDRV